MIRISPPQSLYLGRRLISSSVYISIMDNYWCFMTSLLLLVVALTAQTRAGCSTEGFLYDSETRDEDLAAPQLVSTDTRRQSMCCPGKNNTCIAEGPRLNDLSSPSCFCDTSCIEIGDCCTDYAMACPGNSMNI